MVSQHQQYGGERLNLLAALQELHRMNCEAGFLLHLFDRQFLLTLVACSFSYLTNKIVFWVAYKQLANLPTAISRRVTIIWFLDVLSLLIHWIWIFKSLQRRCRIMCSRLILYHITNQSGGGRGEACISFWELMYKEPVQNLVHVAKSTLQFHLYFYILHQWHSIRDNLRKTLSLYNMWATYKNTFYEVRKSLLDLVLLNRCGPGTMRSDDTASLSV